MNVKEAAHAAGVKEKTLRMHILRGKIRATKAGGAVNIDENDLNAYIITEALSRTIEETAGKPATVIYLAIAKVLDRIRGYLE